MDTKTSSPRLSDPTLLASFSTRACPHCGSAHSPQSMSGEVHSIPRAEDLPFEQLKERWYGFFKDRAFFTYVRCSSCGMLYSPTYFSSAQLDDLYASMPANMAEASHTALERTQRGYYEHLRRNAPLRGEFLEIGPDNGVFAKYCLDNGSFSRAWMFEPNTAVHEELRLNTQATQTHIKRSLEDFSEIADGSIGVCAMIHVLDHLTDPLPFLQKLRKKMAAGASVLIVTHDERSSLARLLNRRWPAYCLQHPHLFNPHSIAAMLTTAGFERVQVERSTNYFPIRFLAKQALLAAGIDSGNTTAFLPSAQVPLRLGNMITIARTADQS